MYLPECLNLYFVYLSVLKSNLLSYEKNYYSTDGIDYGRNELMLRIAKSRHGNP